MQSLENVLIIGGTGFIGSELTSVVAGEDGLKIEVVYVGELKESDKIRGVEYKNIDFSHTSDEAREVVQGVDCIVLLVQPNEDLIKNVLNFAKDSNVKKIVYTSTLLLYPDSTEKQDETANLDPVTEYEKQKLKEERHLKGFANSETKVCIARLGNVYGTQKNKGIVNIIIQKLEANEELIVNGNGEQKRDYIFVKDVVRALGGLIFYDQKKSLEIFNVCTGKFYSINQLISELEKISGKKLKKRYGQPLIEKQVIVGDNSKIYTKIDFEPKHSLGEGLNLAYHNYLNN